MITMMMMMMMMMISRSKIKLSSMPPQMKILGKIIVRSICKLKIKSFNKKNKRFVNSRRRDALYERKKIDKTLYNSCREKLYLNANKIMQIRINYLISASLPLMQLYFKTETAIFYKIIQNSQIRT